MRTALFKTSAFLILVVGIFLASGCSKNLYLAPCPGGVCLPTPGPTEASPTPIPEPTAVPTPEPTSIPTQVPTSIPSPTPVPTAIVQDATAADFQEKVLASDMPVMVLFYATWCPYCNAFKPIAEQFIRDHAGEIKLVRVDIDQEPGLTSLYHVTGIPTSVFFVNGSEVDRVVGLVGADVLLETLDGL